MNRNALRFSIASVLFVCLVVAGTFAGYRAGFSEGYASGKAKRQSEEPFPKVYEVGDLMRSAADPDEPKAVGAQLNIDPLMQAAATTVYPDEWAQLGGPCTMAPLPWLESIAINATSGVHHRLESFFADLASVKLAVADAKKQNEAAQRLWEEAVTKALMPVEKSLNAPLEPIAADVNLVGSWEVRPGSAGGSTNPTRYTFIDKDTVTIASPGETKPTQTWYMTSPASLVISGTAYMAAWTADQDLVLIQQNASDSFLVADRVEGEQADEREPE